MNDRKMHYHVVDESKLIVALQERNTIRYRCFYFVAEKDRVTEKAGTSKKDDLAAGYTKKRKPNEKQKQKKEAKEKAMMIAEDNKAFESFITPIKENLNSFTGNVAMKLVDAQMFKISVTDKEKGTVPLYVRLMDNEKFELKPGDTAVRPFEMVEEMPQHRLIEWKEFSYMDNTEDDTIQTGSLNNEKKSETIYDIFNGYSKTNEIETMGAMKKAFTIISKKFEMKYTERNMVYESFVHGFYHGVISMLFKYSFAIDCISEKRASRGYIDMVLLLHKQSMSEPGDITTIPIAVEIKHNKNSDTKIDDAIEQGVNKGYVRMRLAVRTNAKKAIMIGLELYQSNDKNTAKMLLAQFVGIPDESFVRIVSNTVSKGEYDREEIRNAMENLYHSSYFGHIVPYLNKMISGQLLTTNRFSESKKEPFEKYLLYGDDPSNQMKFWLNGEQDEPLILLSLKSLQGGGKRSKALPQFWDDDNKIILPNEFQSNFEELLKNKKVFSVCIQVNTDNSGKDKFSEFLKVENIVIKKLTPGNDEKSISWEVVTAKNLGGGEEGTSQKEYTKINTIKLDYIDSTKLVKKFAELEQPAGSNIDADVKRKMEKMLTDVMKKLTPIIKKEKGLQAIMDGMLRTQKIYDVYIEESAGTDRMDIFLMKGNNIAFKDPNIIIELKTDTIKTGRGLPQAASYVPQTKHMSNSERAIIMAIGYRDNQDIKNEVVMVVEAGTRTRSSSSRTIDKQEEEKQATDDQGKDIINDFKEVNPTVQPLSKTTHLLESSSHIANSALLAVDLVGAIDEAFKGKYERLVRLSVSTAIYQSAPRLGNVVATHFLPKLSNELAKFYPYVGEAIASTVVQRVSRFVKGVPTGVLNIIEIGMSTRDLVHHINETIETWDNKDWAERSGEIMHMCVDVCNIATNGAQLVILMTGQVEAEPFVAAIQIGCLWAGYMNENFLEIWDIRKDIDVSAWEIAKGFVPISAINNKDQLRTDQTVKRIYEQFLIESEMLNYYDGIVTSLYDVTLEEVENQLGDELINASRFINKQRFSFSAEHNYFLTFPFNPVVKIRDSIKNENVYTKSPSRTLSKMGQREGTKKVKIVCSPTGEDAIDICATTLQCNNETVTKGTFYSIPNSKNESDEINYCDYAIGFTDEEKVKSKVEKGEPLRMFYDIRAEYEAHVQVGINDSNHIAVYHNSYINGSEFKDMFHLSDTEFNPEKLRLSDKSKNGLVLNGANFSLTSALSAQGRKIKSIIGTTGVPQVIHLGPVTCHVFTGGQTKVFIYNSDCKFLRIEASCGDTIVLADFIGHVFLNVVDNCAFASKLNFTNSYVKVKLPKHFVIEENLSLNLFSADRTIENLNRYRFSYDFYEEALKILSDFRLFCKIYTKKPTKGLKAKINNDLSLKLLFDPRFSQAEFIGVYYKFTLESDDYTPLMKALKFSYFSHLTAESTDICLIWEKTRNQMSFAYSANKPTIISMRSIENAISIEYCESVTVKLENDYMLWGNLDRVYFVEVKQYQFQYNAYKVEKHLNVSYDCKNGNSSYFLIKDFYATEDYGSKIILKFEDDHFEEIKIEQFKDRFVHRERHVPEETFHVAGFLNSTLLFSLKNAPTHLFLPIIFDSEMLLLKYGTSLVLYLNKKHITVYFEDFEEYTKEIQLHFRNEIVSLVRWAKFAVPLQSFVNEQDLTLLTHHIDNGKLLVVNVFTDFDLHLQDLSSQVILSIECPLQYAEIVKGKEESGMLYVRFGEKLLTVYDWDNTDHTRRPFFIFDAKTYNGPIKRVRLGEAFSRIADKPNLGLHWINSTQLIPINPD
ncbi:hypothetical protein Ddc_12090 [Ditylenchus destructor]|nr:hypothetical protein Ddc_12090 [Ditylenchus destructor]